MSRTRSADIVIGADPSTVFDVLCDPEQHRLFDGSGSVKGRASGPPRLYLGAGFAMRMRIGVPYLVRNRVIEYDEDRTIAWRHFGRHVWRYTLEPTGDDGRSTRVTETFDYGPSPLAPLYERTGVVDTNHRSIEATLQRLKALVEGRVPTA